MELDKKKVYILVFLLIIIATLIVMNYTKNCNYDESCFNKHAQDCSRAKANLYRNENEYKFEITGKKEDKCRVVVYMIKANEETISNVRGFLEGKGMVCEVPKTELQNPISEITNIKDYCTGPLKEALLQITVEKLYELVTKNIGPVALEQYSGKSQ